MDFIYWQDQRPLKTVSSHQYPCNPYYIPILQVGNTEVQRMSMTKYNESVVKIMENECPKQRANDFDLCGFGHITS